jgi:hypothetical protein
MISGRKQRLVLKQGLKTNENITAQKYQGTHLVISTKVPIKGKKVCFLHKNIRKTSFIHVVFSCFYLSRSRLLLNYIPLAQPGVNSVICRLSDFRT